LNLKQKNAQDRNLSNGLKDEISQNNNQQSQQKQTQGLDPAVMQIIQQGNEILKRAKGV